MVYKNAIVTSEEFDQTEVEQVIIDEIHREWKLCLTSDRPWIECNALYESMLRAEKPLVRMKHYHAMLEEHSDVHNKCCKSGRSKDECNLDKEDRESKISVMEKELYPWIEIYELCIAELSRDKCYNIFKELQIPRYRTLVPESLITLAKAHICLDAGRSEEDCENEAMEHYIQVVQPKDEL
ncbi:uncharacterized protein LOC131670445 isoform X2 [Phymastichus coffea]|nr:uncharacterized protein LOC131670445 isoform X2 [Phymastichus coffea]